MVRERALALVGLLLAGLSAMVAYCMLVPVRWDGMGKLGALALYFPLHLLLVTLAAAVLMFVAARCQARLGAWLLGFAVVLSATAAITPVVAVWRVARELNVPLSLCSYLENATHMNAGPPQPERSVEYGKTPDGTKLELDVWPSGQPDTGKLRPAIVVVHGGAWTHGNRSVLPDWNGWLNSLGYEVFDVEYRMPPPVRWLDEIGDVKSALGWLATHAAQYHVDPELISLMGASAGANLALLAAYSSGDPRLPPSTDVPPVAIHSVINFYGPTEMALLYRTCESPDYVRPLIEAYIGGPPEAFPERYRLLSPINHVSASSPPTITLIGTSDRLVHARHAASLHEALTKAGVPHELYLLPANDHAFDINWGGFGTQVARAKIQAFLERYADR